MVRIAWCGVQAESAMCMVGVRGCEVQCVDRGVAGHGVQGAHCRLQGVDCTVRGAWCRVWIMGWGLRSVDCGAGIAG